MNYNLPKNLSELSSISKGDYPVDKWEGAVNFVIIEDHIALIKRSETMPSHSGQIGLFGGHRKPEELDPIETALREFQEETSISSDRLAVRGLVLPVKTSRNKWIIPVVSEFEGSIKNFSEIVESNGEWDNLVLAPLDLLKDHTLWQHAQTESSTSTHAIFFLPLLKEHCIYLHEAEETFLLWGATAKMTLNFFQK